MQCLYCRRKIGPIRSIWDARFCSAEHQKRYTTRSARVLRDVTDAFGIDEEWSEEPVLGAPKREEGRRGYLMIGLTVVAFGCMSILIPQAAQNVAAPDATGASAAPHSTNSYGTTFLGRLVGAKSTISMREEFNGNLEAWRDVKSGSDWVREAGAVRPGRMRIWEPSQLLSNYEFEFMGRIERKSMNWAFRAADSRNYYATKLAILRPDTTALVRWVVLDGRVLDHNELPLPLKLDTNTDYRIHLSVRGRQYLTFIDGRVVSSWNDGRIMHGGVGFFSDDGEVALLKWASLSERDSLMGRVLSHFSILMLPPGAGNWMAPEGLPDTSDAGQ